VGTHYRNKGSIKSEKRLKVKRLLIRIKGGQNGGGGKSTQKAKGKRTRRRSDKKRKTGHQPTIRCDGSFGGEKVEYRRHGGVAGPL